MDKEWIFLSNTFEVQTRGTQVRALSLFTDTHAKLKNEDKDEDIAIMFVELDPVYNAYAQLYGQKQSIDGIYEGKTLGFEEILEQMPTELRKWESKVRYFFPEDTPTEHEIFPNKRSPFLTGTYETRILAVSALAEKLGNYSDLSAAQLQVQSYYNLLQGARLAQQEKEGASKQLSNLLENQRVVVCEVMYGILGLLMHKFRSDRPQIARFFDLTLLRNTNNGDNQELPENQPTNSPIEEEV